MMQKGFSLIECMAYSFLFILLSTMLFSWLAAVQNRAMRRDDAAIGIACALDMFARDVRCAPSDPALWKKVTNHELIWHANNTDIGWLVMKNKKGEKNELFRIEGAYSTGIHAWIKKTKNVIAQNIHDVTFDVRSNEHNQVVQVRCMSDTKIDLITLRNRAIG